MNTLKRFFWLLAVLAFVFFSCDKDKVTDFSRPEVAIVEPGDGTIFDFGTVVTVKVTAKDNRKVDRVVLNVDGEKKTLDSPPYEYSWRPDSLGLHVLKAKVYDGGDNWRETDEDVRFHVTMGKAKLTAPEPGATLGVWEPVMLAWERVPGVSGYWVEIDSSAGFKDPVISVADTVSFLVIRAGKLPHATYYWRVRLKGPEWGAWSAGRDFTIEDSELIGSKVAKETSRVAQISVINYRKRLIDDAEFNRSQ